MSQLQAIATRWEALRIKAITDVSRSEADLVLHATNLRLGREKERQEIAKRFKNHPAREQGLASPEEVSDGIKRLREEIKTMSRWRQ